MQAVIEIVPFLSMREPIQNKVVYSMNACPDYQIYINERAMMLHRKVMSADDLQQ